MRQIEQIDNKAIQSTSTTRIATVEKVRGIHASIVARDDQTGYAVIISRHLLGDEPIVIGDQFRFEEALRFGRQITAGRVWKLKDGETN